MKTIHPGSIVAVAANLGVILGLALVAFELRQNSELMRIQINQARADAAMFSNEQSFNSAYIPAILVKVEEGTALSAEEWIRYVDYFRAMNRNQDNVLSQWKVGMLDDNTPRSVTGYACFFIGANETSREAWEMTKEGYTDSYILFIEDALENCD